jgi:uncharacterized membrane protein
MEPKASNQKANVSSYQWLMLAITLIIVTVLCVLLDIPFLRQISSFVMLTFLPGFLLLRILKLNELGWWERLVLSIGLSLAFLLLFGLLHNGLLSVWTYEKPLSTIPLLTSFSIAIMVLSVVASIRSKSIRLPLTKIKLTNKEKALLILPSCFPILSILGTHVMNVSNNNSCLMFLLFLIPAYIIFVSVYHQKISASIFAGLVFLVGISLLLMFALRSNYVIIGSDTGRELYYFQAVLTNQRWSVIDDSALNSCLSISLLPSIYQRFLDIRPDQVFKLLYVPLLSIMPVGVYILAKKSVGNFSAFLASFFFMSQGVFLAATSNVRTSMAILFAILAVIVLFHDRISIFNRGLLFIVFVACTVLSHYATTYLLFFILLFSWVGILVRRTGISLFPGRDAAPRQTQPRQRVSSISLVLFLALIFLWYSQITVATFEAGVNFSKTSATSLREIFNPEARNVGIPLLFGTGWTSSAIAYKIGFVSKWATYILTGFGVISLLYRNRTVSILDKNSESGFTEARFETEYLIITLVCSLILVGTIVVPYVSIGYSMERLYLLAASILAPAFVVGGINLAKYTKIPRKLFVLTVAVLYFLCSTGSLGQVFGVPGALTLNSKGLDYDAYYVHDQEGSAARWLRSYGQLDNTLVYADHMGDERLLGWGPIPPNAIRVYPLTDIRAEVKGYLYLRFYNVVNGQLLDLQSMDHSITEYQDEFDSHNKIYTNGGSDVYKF